MYSFFVEQVEIEKIEMPYSMLQIRSGVDGVDKYFFFTLLKFWNKKNNRFERQNSHFYSWKCPNSFRRDYYLTTMEHHSMDLLDYTF